MADTSNNIDEFSTLQFGQDTKRLKYYTFAFSEFEQVIFRFRGYGNQQSATGLRVTQNMLLVIAQRAMYFMTIAIVVPDRTPGYCTGIKVLQGFCDYRNFIKFDNRTQATAFANFTEMAY